MPTCCKKGRSGCGVRLVEEALWREQVWSTLREMVNRLPEPQPEVVRVCYGLDGGPARSMATLARWYGVLHEAVRIWRNNALAQLRMPFSSVGLREVYERGDRPAYGRAQALNRAWLGRTRRNKR